MATGRTQQAWHGTASAEKWQWRFIESLVVLAVMYAVLLVWFPPDDRAENVILGLAAGVATLLAMPVLEFLWRYIQLGKPLRELRDLISRNPTLPEGQGIHVKALLEASGGSFTPLHIAALRALNADDDLLSISFTYTLDEYGATKIIDATITPVAERFSSKPNSAGPLSP